jgi:hypothetical protein
MMRALLAFNVAAMGCYRPAGEAPCSVRCDDGVCPSSLECGADMLCHAPGAAACMLPADGPSLCSGQSTMCSADTSTLITCPASGQMATSTPCSWGCVASGSAAHCGALQPTGGAVTGGDFVGGAMDGSLATVVVDTDQGKIGGMTWPWFHTHNNVGIFSFGNLVIGGGVTFVGSNAVAFVANGDITIDGVVDARGSGCTNGGADRVAGPGGSTGASPAQTGAGSGSGGEAGDDSAGGGGGGYGGAGGSGGYFTDSTQAGAAGTSWGSAPISVLAGGGGGGAASDPNGGPGGGGGGAIQFVSNTTIKLGSNGGINAGGCGGVAANGTHGGGGGGAGGAIVLEAPTLTIAGKIAANGGGGGGGDTPGATDGSAGKLGSGAAAGGAGHNASGDEDGGSGGANATFAGATAGNGGGHGGGGGGGVGRIRLNSRQGSATTTLSTGFVISPDPSAPNSPATIAAARIQ